MIPFVPIIMDGEEPFSMFVDLQNKHDWALATISYRNKDELIENFENGIIARAEAKYQEIEIRRLKELQAPIPINKIDENN